ncbi:RNA-binding protein 1 [Armadillidium vulgare]|nr:RNA-binding protein 1 [Armadillidium vulgare]
MIEMATKNDKINSIIIHFSAKHELEAAFSKYGPLLNVWVARNPPGFAFVEFEDPREAEDAVRALDGTRLCGVREPILYCNF